MKRAAIYVRTATEGARGDQCAACEALCATRGWQLAGVYLDERRSGADLERPGLQRMLSDVAAGAIDVVVVRDVSRLSRSPRDLASVLAQLEDAGVALRSVADGISIGRLPAPGAPAPGSP